MTIYRAARTPTAQGLGAQAPADGGAGTRQQGFNLQEAAVGTVMLAFTFLAMAGAFSSNIQSMSTAKAYGQAAVFLDETLASLEGQSYDAVIAMNGNQFFNHEFADDARFRIELTVTPSAVDLLTVRGICVDQIKDEVLMRAVTYKSRR